MGYASVKEFKKAVGDKLRGHLGVEDKFVTDEIPAKIDEVYAAGQASGGGGGASDPAAEAVMSLLSRCHDNMVGDWTSSPPDGVLVCSGDSQNPTFCIIPPNITDIYGYGFLSNVIVLGGLGTIILSLPSAPPFPRSDSLVWDSSHRPEAIYVPDKSVEAYRVAEQWSEFADLIKPMSLLVNEITFHFEHPHSHSLVEFTVTKGTTFGEWIESDEVKNHPSGIYDWMGAYNNHISTPSQDVYRADTKEFVLLSDAIISGMTYLCNVDDYYQ